MSNIIEKIFGSKHDRDIKQMTPVVSRVNEIYETLAALSDDEIRQKTAGFKETIAASVREQQQQIVSLKERLKTALEDPAEYDTIRDQVAELETDEKEITEKVLKELLPEAFAVVKETCRRLVGKSWKVVGRDITWDMVPFDVQIIGGIVLHEGKIAEMATGEGKTLVATFPLFLNALVGKGVHLVTVNDYLARRDCEWMGEIFKFHGLTVAYITNDMTPPERKKAYDADITYGTNNEFGFDYLRDNMTISPEGLVQRGHHFAIIDEVDSVLIDEARTPLIISGPVGESKNRFAEMKPLVEKVMREQSRLVNTLVSEGENLLQQNSEYDAGIKLLQAQRGAPKNKRLVKILREPGTQKLIRRVESDYMRDKIMHELDAALYFVIDEKSHTIDLTEKGRQYMAPNNQDMFVLPDLATELSAIEGAENLAQSTIERKKEELQAEYAEKSERLHNISQLFKAYSLFEKDVEYVVSEDGKVMIVDEFTGRLMPGRRFSDGLHQALEAKENVQIERETQTFATITLQNFFRLYTKLSGMTGTAETEASEFWEIYKLDVVVIPTNEPIRRDDLDDLVYRTKREKYNAIIDQIEEIHNEGYPVLVGTITVEVSETLSRMLKRKGIHHNVLNAKYHAQEAEIVARAGEPGMVTIATNMAGRGTDIKLGAGVIRVSDEELQELTKDAASAQSGGNTVFIHDVPDHEITRFSDAIQKAGLVCKILDTKTEKEALLSGEQKLPAGSVALVPRRIGEPKDTKIAGNKISHLKIRNYAEGGLHIIGTERHEARRIDRQLRGRSGRQGDPGVSRFFLSLEDDLMRLFGSDRIAGVMDKMGLEEGEVITHSMITNSIGRAQKRVETRNFDIRKHLLEYDDVMNKQREVIYHWRRRALLGESMQDEIVGSIEDFVEDVISRNTITEGSFDNAFDWQSLSDEFMKTMLLPLPISESERDGIRHAELSERLQEAALQSYQRKHQTLGKELMAQLERYATLRTIDEKWKEHLYEMDQLKEGINLRAFGQKDPLLEYKREAFETFSMMLDRVRIEILELVFKAQIQVERPDPMQRRHPVEMAAVHENASGMGFAENRMSAAGSQPPVAGRQQPIKVEHKVGRNDPCPCGSGKKFKHCHGNQ